MLKNKKLNATMITVGLILLVSGVLAALELYNGSAVVIGRASADKEKALENGRAAVDALGESNVDLEVLDSYPIDEFYAVGDKDRKLLIKVKKSDGKTISVSNSDAINESGNKRIPADEASGKATQFAEKMGVNLDGFTLAQESLGADSPAKNLYIFKWTKTEKGVLLPSYTEIAVNMGSGKIATFNSVDIPITVPLEPKKTRVEAVDLAVNTLGLADKGDKVKMLAQPDAALRVVDKKGIQALVWVVDFKYIEALSGTADAGGIGRLVSIVVDANTGEVLQKVQ
ncbi:MAG: hypothetical protein QME41_08675 [Actinomycetota bacterium]|nr:hypothetical protein [Actinomycetota bacterium]